MTKPDYRRWLEMSDEEALAEFRRLERLDLLAEILWTVGGAVLVGVFIGLGIWLWN